MKKRIMFERNSRRSNSKSTKVKTIVQKTFDISLELFGILLGLVFIFSGFVKAIDPLGSTYKIQDYLTSFGDSFVQFHFIAFPLGIALSTIELLIGLCFLLKIKLKTTSILAVLFMLIMLPLTLYLAVTNRVSDCGCFGDAIKLTNWETFYKNVILFILILFVLFNTKKNRNLFLPNIEWIFIILFLLSGVGISIYSVRHLPMIDFLPYKVGVNIPEGMKVPEGKPVDKYDTKLIYEKDGVSKEFTLQNYPKDSTWHFVDQKTTLISKGYEPPIHNFTVVDAAQNDITDEVIHFQGDVYLVVMYDVNNASKEGAIKAETLYQQTKSTGAQFYVLSGSTVEDIAKFAKENKLTFPFYNTDPTTLKTIIRANPGFVTIKNGTITGKWNWRDFE